MSDASSFALLAGAGASASSGGAEAAAAGCGAGGGGTGTTLFEEVAGGAWPAALSGSVSHGFAARSLSQTTSVARASAPPAPHAML
ncbi:MAG TPA: hypothetical protein VG937_24460 [Polyangiaceae bacterium]|nr:hypothetical protein [Polyangiaceae bacterium]